MQIKNEIKDNTQLKYINKILLQMCTHA